MSPVILMARAIMVLLVAGLVFLVGQCVWTNRGDTFRYRLTVAVESGGRVYTGSSVIQVRSVKQGPLTQAVSLPKVTGDAVVVDVPGRNPIFVLLSQRGGGDWDASIAIETFRHRLPNPKDSVVAPENRGQMAALRGDAAEIPADEYPLVVAFGDLSRPETVYELPSHDLSRALGPGSRVLSMTIEMTDDQVTYQIDKVLPWVAPMGGHLDGTDFCFTRALSCDLAAPDFRKRGT